MKGENEHFGDIENIGTHYQKPILSSDDDSSSDKE